MRLNTQHQKLLLYMILPLIFFTWLIRPGDTQELEKPIKIARPTWDAAWFHPEIYRYLLQELGYSVADITTRNKPKAYEELAQGTIDLWFNMEEEVSHLYIKEEQKPLLDVVGHIYEQGTVVGYIIDKATVDRFNIKSLADLKRPEVKQIYDTNNNGKAEVFGCNKDWACYKITINSLKAYGLEEHVEVISSRHSHLSLITLERFKKGKPFILLTWAPHWTPGIFEPGKQSYWLPVPFDILHTIPGYKELNITSKMDNLKGCLKPCFTGFVNSNLRAVGNKAFLAKHPDIRKLLELVKIPADDMSLQHKRMFKGEDEIEDIRRHAREWLLKHHEQVESWLKSARQFQSESFKQAIIERKKKYLRVIIKPFEPLVLVQKNQFTGFAIELWEQIAKDLKLEFHLVLVHSIAKLLSELQLNKADVGISGVGISSSREDTLDFSNTVLSSGLQIMIPQKKQSALGRILNIIISWQFMGVAIGLLIILFLAAHIIWFIEKGKNHEGFPTTYWRGIMESIWWAGAITSGREGWGKPLATPAAKMFTFFWMFIGYFIFVYFTATMSSSFTVKEVTHNINTIEDLKDKKVVTLKYSVAEEFLIEKGLTPVTVRNIDEAYNMIESGKVDAMVYHALVMKYYLSQRGKGKMTLVGDTFYQQEYGFALKHNSPIREEINRSLLKLEESGAFQQLYNKWFGQLGK